MKPIKEWNEVTERKNDEACGADGGAHIVVVLLSLTFDLFYEVFLERAQVQHRFCVSRLFCCAGVFVLALNQPLKPRDLTLVRKLCVIQ